MSYTFDEIRTCVAMMQAAQGPLLAKMRDIQIRYDGDFVIPMPDLENEPKMPQLTPALVGEAIDQIAMRAASVQPIITCPPLDNSKDRGKRSRQYGSIRGQIIGATLEKSRWQLGRRRLYRQLTAYHTGSAVVVPDMQAKMPRIEVRDPLSTYIEPQSVESLRDPLYAAFVTVLSGERLRQRWPQLCNEFGGPITTVSTERMWQIVEWYDNEETVWGLLGPCQANGSHVAGSGYATYGAPAPYMELERLPNRAGVVPVMVPHNVSLAGIASRIGALLGNIDLQAKMMALHISAQEKAIFPDMYVLATPNEEPEIVNGTWQDGRSGVMNILKGVSQVGTLRTTPDQQTNLTIDRLERNFRTSTSLVPQLGGETYGAMRTGRAIDALSGMALDPRVQEVHEIMEAHMPTLNTAILATYKGYWPNKQYSMFAGSAQRRKMVDFTPAEHIETFENAVSYVAAGADMAQLTQLLGTLRGADAISQRTFQDSHPMIGDADAERAQLHEEKLENAALEAIQQQILSGALPPTVAGMLADKMSKGKSVFEAIEETDAELRKLQATQAPEPDPASGMQAPPESMPGLTGGPAADQQPAPFTQPQAAPQGMAGMRQLMQAMGA